jgi:hypothetical protein
MICKNNYQSILKQDPSMHNLTLKNEKGNKD